MLPRLAALSGFQVVRRVKGESHSVLCLHGGLSPELPRIVGLRPGEVEENLERVNGLFVRALRDNVEARRVILSAESGAKLPTCRPAYVDDSKGLETYFGSTRIVKGHDVQTEGANCNVALGGQPRLRARSGLFAANEMCRIDVGVGKPGKTSFFSCWRKNWRRSAAVSWSLFPQRRLVVIGRLDDFLAFQRLALFRKTCTNAPRPPGPSLRLQWWYVFPSVCFHSASQRQASSGSFNLSFLDSFVFVTGHFLRNAKTLYNPTNGSSVDTNSAAF